MKKRTSRLIKQLIVIPVAFVMVVFATLYLVTIELGDPLLFMLSAILGVILLVALYREYRSGDLASPAALYAGLFLAHFAVPGFMHAQGFLPFTEALNQKYVFQAQILVVLSFIAFLLGARLAVLAIRLANEKRKAPKTQRTYLRWSELRVVEVIVFLVVIGFIVRFYIISKGLYFQDIRALSSAEFGAFQAVLRMMERFPLLALYITAIFFFRYFSPLRTTPYKSVLSKERWIFIFVVLEILEIAYWLPSGRKGDLMYAIIIPFLIRYLYVPKLPPLKILIPVAATIVIVFQVNSIYRSTMGAGGYSRLPVTEAVVGTLEEMREDELLQKKSEDKPNPMLSRLNILEPVSACIRLVDSGAWPLSYGEQYIGLALLLIPRAIWESKPVFSYGTDFGHKAGIIDYSNKNTSISVTFIGESFLNFSWLGPVVMVAFGWFFTWLYSKAKSSHSETFCLMYILSFPFLLYPGGTFIIYFGGLIQSWLFAGLLFVYMARQPSSKPITALQKR